MSVKLLQLVPFLDLGICQRLYVELQRKSWGSFLTLPQHSQRLRSRTASAWHNPLLGG